MQSGHTAGCVLVECFEGAITRELAARTGAAVALGKGPMVARAETGGLGETRVCGLGPNVGGAASCLQSSAEEWNNRAVVARGRGGMLLQSREPSSVHTLMVAAAKVAPPTGGRFPCSPGGRAPYREVDVEAGSEVLDGVESWEGCVAKGAVSGTGKARNNGPARRNVSGLEKQYSVALAESATAMLQGMAMGTGGVGVVDWKQ
jgi:hypothetical protein